LQLSSKKVLQTFNFPGELFCSIFSSQKDDIEEETNIDCILDLLEWRDLQQAFTSFCLDFILF
jgi:hypothetical protein